ncbi:MAG: bifunctional [glutamate--ammonia ligase]-adenylyl-L-tyrosine phosphorylase/[glutamate--ammonia-ligase] adenylyltransferase [Candidatus Nitrospinota bacterium M3_3B_026]
MTLEDIAAKTADPGAALAGLERTLAARPALAENEKKLFVLAHLFTGSEFLTHWLLSRPEDIDWLVEDGKLEKPRDTEDMSSSLALLLSSMAPMPALRRFRSRELARIAARELSGLADLEETMEEWSAVAELAIDAALSIAEREALKVHGVPLYTELEGSGEKLARICVLGLGKLGGRELNISSDVDIVFVHTSDRGQTRGREGGAGVVSLHEFFVKIARETVRLLGEATEDGIAFRVDLDLRPEGNRGEITNSIGAMEIYYESWGQQWERQALIKARHCGGAREVSEEILGRLKPFVYRKYLDQRAIDEISAMKDKIDQSLNARIGAGRAAKDIKLGRGGIREIEFVVQALQLLYGARYPELQTRSTLEALSACRSLGLLSAPWHRDLKEAYIFYRRLENRIQYHQGIQTHSLPGDEKRLGTLGRLMGLSGDGAAERLRRGVERRRKRVRSIFDMFFAKDKKPAESFPVPLENEEAAAEWLDSLGFDKPEAAARSLNTLRNGRPFTHPSDKSRMTFDRFGPALVAEAAAAPWSDNVIMGFERFVDAKGGREMLYELLDRHRPVIKLLAAVFSSSERLTSVLIKQPDILDRLLGADPVGKPADRMTYRAELAAKAAEGKNLEDRMARINAFRVAERLRLGVRRLLGLADRFELMLGLTVIAEEYLRKISGLAEAEAGPRPDDARWVILAAGKLGRREMNFGSDLDMLVFYDGGEDAKAYVTRLTQKIISLCGMMTPYGEGYAVDMRLRPDGENGPLARSYGSMAAYYKNRAQPWERLALVGARPISGDDGLADSVMETIGAFITTPPLTPEEAAGIAAIRERIAKEKTKSGALDIKFGKGGLIEIEFICQWLLLENGLPSGFPGEDPLTIATIQAARGEGWLGEEDAAELERSYIFYRAIEDALRMDAERAVSVAPTSISALRRVARSVAEAGVGPDRFLDATRERMEAVRDIYLRFVGARKSAPARHS